MSRHRFTASAPVRLDFAGGWTDVAPFAVEERGLVVNAAIELRVQAEVETGGERYELRSDDLDQVVTADSLAGLPRNGPLLLLTAALRRAGIGPAALRTHSRVPPGSGLGSSGALDVALVAALGLAGGTERPPPDLAEEAFRLEAMDAALPGGRQDQYAAALGGFLRLGFDPGGVRVERIPVSPAFRHELEQRTVICYTGVSRLSSSTIERVMNAYRSGDPRVTAALRGMVEVAERMSDALRDGDLEMTAQLLSRNWEFQQQLDPDMRTAEMARLEAAMRSAGALGGKAAGAGAGGSMLFLVTEREAAEQAAREAGATVLPFTWSEDGVRTWRG